MAAGNAAVQGKRPVSLFLPTQLDPASQPPRNPLPSSTQGCTLPAILSGGFTPMLIGYARVSKSDGSQTLAPQRDALIGAGVEPDRIYQDLASGRHDARPGLSACLKALQPDNTLVLWKLDRLGRDLKHLVETAESLRVRGIFTPMEFYNAPLPLLKQQVFRSINGYYWYLRLRGHEIDAIDFARKSFGNTYALQKQTNDPRDLAKLLIKLCEKTGRRLRRSNYSAHGVHVAMVHTDFSWWHTGRKFGVPVYTTQEIYEKAMRLLNMSGYKRRARNLAVSVYDLVPSTDEQLELFSSPKHEVSKAMDRINDRYGEFVITPALMMGMEGTILDRIAFGGVKELQELYTE